MIEAILGVPVVESPLVPRGQVLLVNGRLEAGDVGHFVHRLRMSAIKAQMRADLEKLLDDFAASVGVTR